MEKRALRSERFNCSSLATAVVHVAYRTALKRRRCRVRNQRPAMIRAVTSNYTMVNLVDSAVLHTSGARRCCC